MKPCKKPRSVWFEIHIPCSPDLIAGYPPSPICSTPIPSSQHKYLPSNQLRSSVTGVLNAALNTKISLSPLPVPSSRILLSLKRTFKGHTVSDVASERDAISKSPPPHPIFPSTQTVPQTSQSRLSSVFALSTTYALHPFSPHA